MSATSAPVAADPHASHTSATDDCFACKLAYWRQHGMNVSVPDGWRGPSVFAKAKKQVDEARAAGYDPVNAADKYRWV